MLNKLLNEVEDLLRPSNPFPHPPEQPRTLMPWMLMWSDSLKSLPWKNVTNVLRKDSPSIATKVDIWCPLAPPSQIPLRNLVSNVPEKKKSSQSLRKSKTTKKMEYLGFILGWTGIFEWKTCFNAELSPSCNVHSCTYINIE